MHFEVRRGCRGRDDRPPRFGQHEDAGGCFERTPGALRGAVLQSGQERVEAAAVQMQNHRAAGAPRQRRQPGLLQKPR
jgi:hypothetical protein